MYILTTLVFVVFTLVFKPKYEYVNCNEKRKLGKHLFFSVFLVQVASLIFQPFIVYDLLTSIMLAITTCIFYKVFSNSVSVIKEYGKKTAFSAEEIVGTSILLAITASALGDFAIFGFCVKNILCILIVLVLGWKNGILVGATSGIAIGVILGIIGQSEPVMIASFAFSGMIAGLLNRFGKIGVIVGFLLGNGILAYISNGNTIPVIYIQEILIASLGLLLVPKNIRINVADLTPNVKCLPVTQSGTLETKEETIYKLNNVSEVIQEMAKTYQEVASTVVEEQDIKNEQYIQNRNLFIEDFQNNLKDLENNILYDDICQKDSIIVEDAFDYLQQHNQITSKDLVDIFANYNNYILGFDDEQANQKIEQDIDKVVKTLNYAYKISKLNFVWKQKMNENKKTMSTQLDGVSKAISEIANGIAKENNQEPQNIEREEIILLLNQKDILVKALEVKKEETGRQLVKITIPACRESFKKECKEENIKQILTKVFGQEMVLEKEECGLKKEQQDCTLNFVSEDRYFVQLGIAKATKNKSPISGDSSVQTKLEDGKILLALSDGMGSGPQARKSSQIAVKMLERLFKSGFDKETSMELINSTICLNSEEEMYATLDIAVLDLYSGNIEFIKNGACPTYIKNKKEVQIVKSLSLPAGILNNIDLTVYDRDIQSNDILVMCSDGIIESNGEYQNKELWLKYLLEDMNSNNAQKIADIILAEAIDNGYGVAKDDMTVIVAKFIKR